MRNRVAVLHGVNLDALDRRPPELYGGITFARLELQVERYARELGLEASFFQTNHEGEYVEELHKAPDYADGLLLNPAVDHDAVLAAVQRDKKRRGGRVGFVLVEAPGEVRTGVPVAESDIRAALSSLR